MATIRLGNTVRYADRLWVASGLAHRDDGAWLLLVDPRNAETARVRPSDVEDLGDFSRPQSGPGYEGIQGSEPPRANRLAARPARGAEEDGGE